MNSSSKTVIWAVLTGGVGLCVGAYVGADLMNRYNQSFGTVADRLVGELGISTSLLRRAKEEGLELDRSPTAQMLVVTADQSVTTLGMLAEDFRLPTSAARAADILKELEANPLVIADAGSARGKVAKVARECLMAELEKSNPDYASCAASVRATYKNEMLNEILPVLASE